MLRRSILAVVVALAALLSSTAPAGAAVRQFAPQQTLVGGCYGFYGDAVMTTDGSLVGFATCPSPSGEQIRFFRRNPDGTVSRSQASGFVGQVLGVHADATATYVLFDASRGVSIGKRTHAGTFSSRVVAPGVDGLTGDVIARDGRWFGVWSARVGSGGNAELFSAGSTIPIQRVTTTGAHLLDLHPTLAYSGSTPVLIWGRLDDSAATEQSDLLVGKYISGRWQAVRVFASAGSSNVGPDMHIAAGRTFVTWERDGNVWVASNSTGSFTSHRFNTAGWAAKVTAAVTGGTIDHVFVTWSASNRVFFAETASTGSVTGTWQGTYIGPPGSHPWAIGGFATKATAVYTAGPSVASRTQA